MLEITFKSISLTDVLRHSEDGDRGTLKVPARSIRMCPSAFKLVGYLAGKKSLINVLYEGIIATTALN